jgi:hypothetical protein
MRTINNRPQATAGQSSYTVADFSGAAFHIQNARKLWSISSQPAFTETAPLAYLSSELDNMDAAVQTDYLHLASLFNNLPLDRYLQEGATFRYRRFGRFKQDSSNPYNSPEPLPHLAFFQSTDLNPYAGGIQRTFEPMEQEMVDNPYLRDLLINLFCLIPTHERTKFRFWDVGLHPTRVIGKATEAGYGAPEGLHQDGHYFSATVLISRKNVSGGESIFADMQKVIFWQQALLNPSDIVLWRDAHCWHDVTEIIPVDMSQAANRDMIGFTWNPLREQ